MLSYPTSSSIHPISFPRELHVNASNSIHTANMSCPQDISSIFRDAAPRTRNIRRRVDEPIEIYEDDVEKHIQGGQALATKGPEKESIATWSTIAAPTVVMCLDSTLAPSHTPATVAANPIQSRHQRHKSQQTPIQYPPRKCSTAPSASTTTPAPSTPIHHTPSKHEATSLPLSPHKASNNRSQYNSPPKPSPARIEPQKAPLRVTAKTRQEGCVVVDRCGTGGGKENIPPGHLVVAVEEKGSGRKMGGALRKVRREMEGWRERTMTADRTVELPRTPRTGGGRGAGRERDGTKPQPARPSAPKTTRIPPLAPTGTLVAYQPTPPTLLNQSPHRYPNPPPALQLHPSIPPPLLFEPIFQQPRYRTHSPSEASTTLTLCNSRVLRASDASQAIVTRGTRTGDGREDVYKEHPLHFSNQEIIHNPRLVLSLSADLFLPTLGIAIYPPISNSATTEMLLGLYCELYTVLNERFPRGLERIGWNGEEEKWFFVLVVVMANCVSGEGVGKRILGPGMRYL